MYIGKYFTLYLYKHKYSYIMQNGYAIDYKVYGVLSVGVYTLLHPSYVGL